MVDTMPDECEYCGHFLYNKQDCPTCGDYETKCEACGRCHYCKDHTSV